MAGNAGDRSQETQRVSSVDGPQAVDGGLTGGAWSVDELTAGAVEVGSTVAGRLVAGSWFSRWSGRHKCLPTPYL